MTTGPAPRPRRAAPQPGPHAAVIRMQAYHVLAGPFSWAAAGLALLLTAVLAALYVAVGAATAGPPGAPQIGPTATELGFVACSALVLTALVTGCVVAGQEWASGQQCFVLAAVPRRGALLAARWGVTGVLWTGTGLVAGGVVVLLARLVAAGSATPSPTQTLQLVGGSGLAAGLAAVLGVAVATLLRSTLWSVVVTVLASTVLPLFLSGVTQVRWLLPSGALTAMASLPSDMPGVLQPAVGLAVGLGWCVLTGLAAWWRLVHDDV